MSTPSEVAKSIKEHISLIIDNRNEARNSGNLEKELFYNQKLDIAKKYLDDYKNDFHVQ
jgi:hypothetical protein